jgi:hypothetical protein
MRVTGRELREFFSASEGNQKEGKRDTCVSALQRYRTTRMSSLADLISANSKTLAAKVP